MNHEEKYLLCSEDERDIYLPDFLHELETYLAYYDGDTFTVSDILRIALDCAREVK